MNRLSRPVYCAVCFKAVLFSMIRLKLLTKKTSQKKFSTSKNNLKLESRVNSLLSFRQRPLRHSENGSELSLFQLKAIVHRDQC